MRAVDVFVVAAPLAVAATFAAVTVGLAIWAADRWDRYR